MVANGAAVTIPIYPGTRNPKIYFIPNATATVCVVRMIAILQTP